MPLMRLTRMVGRIQLVNEDGVVVEPNTHVPYCLWPDRAMKERLLVEKLKTHAMHAIGGTEGVDKDSLVIRRMFSSGSDPIKISNATRKCRRPQITPTRNLHCRSHSGPCALPIWARGRIAQPAH